MSDRKESTSDEKKHTSPSKKAKKNVKKKTKKKKKKKISVVISDKNNTFTAIEKHDFDLLERIYMSYPNDIKRKNKKNKDTVLHHCVKHNNPKFIEYLLPKLPPKFINSINFRGCTAMLIATFERNTKCMRALYSCNKNPKKYKPNPDILNLNGRSCLIYAAMRDDAEIIEYLMTQCDPPPNIDHLDAKKNNKTALMYAVEHNKYNAVNVLLKYGASMHIKNKVGKTVMDEANCVKNIKTFQLLIQKERE
eukprot:948438_1